MAMKAGKKLLSTLLFLMILGFAHEARSQQCNAGSYSVSVPSDLVVTMGDSSAIIPVTVTNNSSSTGSISYVRLDTVAFIYYISNATAAPSGWTVADIKNAGVGGGQTYIEFTTTTNPILPDSSRTFYLFVTGDNNQNIPPRISGSMQQTGVDQTDSIVDDANSTVMTIGPNRNANCFNNTGSTAQWPRRALYGSMTASPSAVGSGGAVTVTFTVTNRSAFTQATVLPDALTVNPSGGCSDLDGPLPASAANLQAGESATFQWSCTANAGGGLRFCDRARNSAGTATSEDVCSNDVPVGDFTAALAIYPSQVTPGQNVTVTMTVANKGSSALHTIIPSLTFPSGVATHVSGHTPGSIESLASGASAVFTWVYTISGPIGTTFSFSGNASASGGVVSNPATANSNLGTIVPYSVEVTPNTAYYLDTNITFSFRIRNAGGYPVFKVRIETPDPGFVYAGASSSCMTSGEITSDPPIVTYQTADTCSCPLPARCVPCTNGVCDFSITYSQLPNVSANVNSSTDFNFHVKIWDTPFNQQNSQPRSDMGVIVRITKNGIVVNVVPESVDPGCSAQVEARVIPAPANGSDVSFAATGGTLYSVTTTTTGGFAYASLRAPKPYESLIPAAMVTATYLGVSASQLVSFPSTTSCVSNLRRFRWQEINP